MYFNLDFPARDKIMDQWTKIGIITNLKCAEEIFELERSALHFMVTLHVLITTLNNN